MGQNDRPSLLWDLAKTLGSFWGVLVDWALLRVPVLRKVININRDEKFAFLVHPRTDRFVGEDVYGMNDIYRPYPAFRWLYRFIPESVATGFITLFAMHVVPITLSRISLKMLDGKVIRGSLLSTVRTPRMLTGAGKAQGRQRHLQNLYELAAAKGVDRVGLGALLPSMTGYGQKLVPQVGYPARSTGHGYTGYMICQYLFTLVKARETPGTVVRVAIVGAAGSTGTATMRVLKRLWPKEYRIVLTLVDLPVQRKKLEERALEMDPIGTIETAYGHSVLHDCDYIIVVTNGENAKLKSEFVSLGSVIIDDSQPRNTGRELLEAGVHVVDVLARVPGLNCNFDFGFQTNDPTVTFTCLAETVIAAALDVEGDLALGSSVDDLMIERVIKMANVADDYGLVGDLPFFSFGRELTKSERSDLLTRQRKLVHTSRPAAE